MKKTWLENSTGNADKISTKTDQNDKTKERRSNMLERKEKAMQVKINTS